jgi:pheromone shutdown protein TraB
MAKDSDYFTLDSGNVHAVPVVHYTLEFAAHVRRVFEQLKPDCVAVELAETMQLQLLHAASRLPDLSLVVTHNLLYQPIYYLAEPCDAAFEALRCALEHQLPAFCIDLDVDYYPEMKEWVPDPYAIQRIGLEKIGRASCRERV